MSSALPRPQAHLRLWRRFHESLVRDTHRLARLLTDAPETSTHELTAWWNRFAPAVRQCDHIAARLFSSVPSTATEAAPPIRSTKLEQAVEAMGRAVGVLAAEADRDDGGESSASDRSRLAREARELVRRHEADTAEYLTRSVTADAYRAWERGAIAALTYSNVSFLAPWLLDELSAADRNALFRDVPHIQALRCDDVWMRRYQHITSAIRQPAHRADTRPA